MSLRIHPGWLLVASFWLLSPACNASTRIEALLQEAEAARSSSPVAFQRILGVLKAEEGGASEPELERIKYLDAYSDAYAGRYEEGIRKARVLTSSSDKNMRFRAGALLVNAFESNGKFTHGLRQLERTLEEIDSIKDPSLRQHGLIVASAIYNQVGQYKLGLRFANRVLSEPAPMRTRCFAGQYKYEALQSLGAIGNNDAPLKSAIEQCVDQHELVVANFLRTTLARCWMSQGKYQMALELLESHLAEVEEARYPRLLGEMHSLIAEIRLSQNDLEGAQQHAGAVAGIDAMANSLPLVTAYKTLYEIAEQRHDPVSALIQYRHYAEADKAYLREVKTRELAYQIVLQENQQRGRQVEMLNRRNTLLRLQQQVDRTSAQNSRLLMLVMGLAAALIGFWAYKTKRMHASLRRMAETDALTGVFNRHHFTLQAEKCLAQCALAGEPASLLMFDLDHFKVINDSYGHSTGDWVLRRVCDTAQEFCRRMDHLGRIGGEEFAVLLHGFDLHAATRLAEDCRVKLAAIDTRESGYKFTVTGSFGVSASSLSGYDLAKLLSHADLMLYRAKREGRNRVRTYAPDMPITMRPQAADEVPASASTGDLASEAPTGRLG